MGTALPKNRRNELVIGMPRICNPSINNVLFTIKTRKIKIRTVFPKDRQKRSVIGIRRISNHKL
jgi:hypothetical protein